MKYNYPSHPYFKVFQSSIKSPATRQVWTNYLHLYMTYHEMKGYPELIGNEGSEANSKLIQSKLIDYIGYKQNAGIAPQSVINHLSALHHFYWINEVDGIKWDRVHSHLGEMHKTVEDKAYTHEQIAKALEFADYRIRVIILLQASTGMRIGAINDKARHFMKLGDLTKIERHGIYSIVIYPGTPFKYLTFCTPECAKAIDDYLQYRRQSGETLTSASPLIRERFFTSNATDPRPASLKAILGVVREVFIKAGLRTVEKGNKHKRKENMLTHGLRKFARRNMRKSGMDPLLIEYLIGHQSGDMKAGVSKLMMTYDPAEDGELLSEYLKAIPNLTISSVEREKFRADKEKERADYLDKTMRQRLAAVEHDIIKFGMQMGGIIQNDNLSNKGESEKA